MSVINQMLKDLEKRSFKPVDPEISFSGIFADDFLNKSETPYRIGIIFVFIILVLISAAVFFHRYYLSNIPKKTQSVASIPINQQTTQISSTPDTVNTPNKAISPAILTNMTLQVQDTMTYLRFMLNQDVFYRVNTNSDQSKLFIVLDQTNLVANFHTVDYLKSAVKGMEMANDKNGNLLITLSLNDKAQLRYFNLMKENDKSHELQIALQLKKETQTTKENDDDSSLTMATIKKPIELFNLEQQYKYTLELAATGQKDKSMQLLMELVNKYPNYRPARESLVALLIDNGYVYNAKKVLTSGMDQDPNYIPFIELKARLLINEGKNTSALQLLQRASPSMVNYPDYYSMLAALYQRQGQPANAAKVYEQLLSYQSNKAVWWIGLAVALETQGRTKEAKEAYTRASTSAGLNPTLTAFVQTRINSG